MEAGLSLGSNIADRLYHLSRAGELILATEGIALATRAPVYETEPVEVPEKFAELLFLNSIMVIKTSLDIEELAVTLRGVEKKMGRKPSSRNAPRTIDIDVIYADGINISTDHMIIPHPRWFRRRFVVQPLCDVRPYLHIPGKCGTVSDILRDLKDPSRVTRLTNEW